MPLRHDKLNGFDVEDLRDDVVAALRAGELCVLPTETVYGLTALPSHPDAAARIAGWKGRDPKQPLTWHVADTKQIESLDAELTLPAKRLIRRYWPGPLTLILPGRRDPTKTVGVRQPANDFTRSVIRAVGEPLWMSSVNTTGEPPLVHPDEIAAACRDGVAIFIDDGVSPLGNASTIVRATGGELEVLREGILSRNDVLTVAADLVLFVCTGNTCRSPLAEVLAREATAQAMGTTADRVLARGLWFASAGTAAVPGIAASDGSRAAAAELGLDLENHQSQPITPALWHNAHRIYCLSDNHRQALLAEAPEVADRVALLRPDGLDIADPFGGELIDYRRARDEIRAAIAARRSDWWP